MWARAALITAVYISRACLKLQPHIELVIFVRASTCVSKRRRIVDAGPTATCSRAIPLGNGLPLLAVLRSFVS